MWQGFFDGACNPNPGERGIGALLISPTDEEFVISQRAGHGTNNEAEYLALIALLELAASKGAEVLTISGDSQLVIYQVRGVWGVKTSSLRPLHRRSVALVNAMPALTLRWIPREENRRADALSTACLQGTGPRDTEQWGSLSDVGAMLGRSAVWVGKRLDAVGLRTPDRLPSADAIERDLGHLFHNGFGQQAQWCTQRVAALLNDRDASDDI